MRKKSDIEQMMHLLEELYPKACCELDYTNAYTLLVAVMLSAQSTDKGVNKATQTLFKIADSPQKMLSLGLDRLKEYIKTIGLYNNKAQNIMRMSSELMKKYDGLVPHSRQALESLAGVGRKTANVVLNVWFGEPTLAVDTHVFRIAHRLGFSDGQTPRAVEDDLMHILPEHYVKNANHLLVLFGRYVCKALKPDCENCVLKDYCKSSDKRI